jgi:hypothetical protein
MVRVLLALLVVVVTRSPAAENNGRGTRAIGLGNAFVALSDNPWGLNYNPSGLSRIRSLQSSIFFVPQQFEMEELRTAAAAVAVPVGGNTLGASFSHFGFDLYRESHLTLGVARGIDWGVGGGIAVNLHRLSFDRYGSAQSMTLDIGLLAEVTERVTLGFSYRNLLGNRIGPQEERLPQTFSLGAAYVPVKNFTLTAEVEKELRYPVTIKAGAEQMFLEIFAVRAGVSNHPDKFTAGFGVRYAMLEFGYAGYSHAQLGWTHQLEFTFSLFTEE